MNPELRPAADALHPDQRELPEAELAPLRAALAARPELSRVLGQAARADQMLAEALRDVPIPAGLAERILAAVDPPGPGSAEVGLQRPTTAARGSRRWLLALSAAAAIAGLCAGLAWYRAGWNDAVWTRNLAVDRASVWLRQLDDRPWRASNTAPRADFHMPPALLLEVQRWQPVAADCVCYELRSNTEAAVRLFVAHGVATSGLPTAPERSAYQEADGWQFGVWRSGPSVYILAVRGDRRDYERQFEAGQVL